MRKLLALAAIGLLSACDHGAPYPSHELSGLALVALGGLAWIALGIYVWQQAAPSEAS